MEIWSHVEAALYQSLISHVALALCHDLLLHYKLDRFCEE